MVEVEVGDWCWSALACAEPSGQISFHVKRILVKKRTVRWNSRLHPSEKVAAYLVETEDGVYPVQRFEDQIFSTREEAERYAMVLMMEQP